MTRTGRAALGALLLVTALTGCDAPSDAADGDAGADAGVPLSQDQPVGPSHPGWLVADCAECHPPAQQHDGQFTLFQCVECHGSNGAPVLGSGHGGYGSVNGYDCWSCHPDVPLHASTLAAGNCALCHGGNGAPAVDLGHFVVGSGRVRCASCHPDATTHNGLFAAADCSGCHPVDGAPGRPTPHYVIACAECHADGAAPWDEATHQDTTPESPLGCALCHPLTP